MSGELVKASASNITVAGNTKSLVRPKGSFLNPVVDCVSEAISYRASMA
jgi:hypothetical protein